MKAISYCSLMALSINMLIVPLLSAAHQRHEVYIKQQVTVTSTAYRSLNDIVKDLGILCDVLIEKPGMCHPKYLLEILGQLIDEYIVACKNPSSQSALKKFRQRVAELHHKIATKKVMCAKKVLEELMQNWPLEMDIVPPHTCLKLKKLESDTVMQFKLYQKLQVALLTAKEQAPEAVRKSIFNR